MFAERIGNTAFSSDFFDHTATCERSGFDSSMLSTMRAILFNRTKEHYELWEYNKVGDSFNGERYIGSPEDFINYFASYDNHNRVLAAIYSSSEFQRTDDLVSAFEKRGKVRGWRAIRKVTEFFRNAFQVIALANDSLKSSIVIVFSDNIRHYHAVQAAILAWMPYIFNKEDGITDDEAALFASLQNGDYAAYCAALDAVYRNSNIMDKMLERALSGIESRKFEALIRDVESDIRSLDNDIRNCIDRIQQRESEIRVLQAKIIGYKIAVDNNSGNELLDFFKSNKNVRLHDFKNGMVYFDALSYLEYWDEEQAERYIENNNSVFYDDPPIGRFVSVNEMHRLLTAVFVDCKLRLRFVARYCMNEDGNISGVADATFDGVFDDRMPNPHIQGWHCLGNYGEILRDASRSGNYVMAVQQCITSCGSLNIGDSTVMERFIKEFYTCTKKCIELPDGTTVAPYDAVKYLKSIGYIETNEEDENNEQND